MSLCTTYPSSSFTLLWFSQFSMLLTAKEIIKRGYHPAHGTILFYQHMGLDLNNQPRIAIQFIDGYTFFGLFDQPV